MKAKTTAYLLWLFLGLWGGHKFYLGKAGMGILYLFTAGLFFIGWIVDLFFLSKQVDLYNETVSAKQKTWKPIAGIFTPNRIILTKTRRGFTLPGELISCQKIIMYNHNDKRVLIHYLTKFDNKSLSDMVPYAESEIGNLDDAVKLLIGLGWIEKCNTEENIIQEYTSAKLKKIIESNGIKPRGNKKEDILKNALEQIPISKFKLSRIDRYKLSNKGHAELNYRTTDFMSAVKKARNYILQSDYNAAISAFDDFDKKWGFVRSGGDKNYTIFVDNKRNSVTRFEFILNHPMNELKNTDSFKNELRAFLFVFLMNGENAIYRIENDFVECHVEKIVWPKWKEYYQNTEFETEAGNSREEIMKVMEQRVNDSPEGLLRYYISKILYESRNIR